MEITASPRIADERKKERDFIAAILDNISVLVVVLDREGRIVRLNRACERTCGYSYQEVKGTFFWDLLLPEEAPAVRQGFEELQTTGENTCETSLQNRQGDCRVIAWSNKAIRNRKGRVAYVVATGIDITRRKQAETKLVESEARYRNLVENIKLGITLIGADYRIIMMNAALGSMFMKPGRESVGKECFREFRRQSEVCPRCPGTKAMATGQSAETEIEGVRQDGSPFPLQVRAFPIFASSGETAGFIEVVEDISSRKRAEAALKESERLYRLLAENVTDVIWTTDLGLRLTYISPSARLMVGYLPEEALLMDLEDLLTPSSLDLARKTLAEQLAWEERETNPKRSVTLELEHVCKNGFAVWAEVKASFLRDLEGRPVGVLGVSRDITERKRAQEALRRSEEQYRLLAENVSDVIWTTDLDLRFTYVSPSVKFMTGYTSEEVMPMTLPQILTPASLELSRKVLADCQASGNYGSFMVPAVEYFCKDGSTAWAEVKGSFLRDAQGDPVGLVGVARDITSRKRLEEQLLQAQKMEVVGRLAGGVAHDFNNLLTAIMGYSELLLNLMDRGDLRRQEVEEIKKAGDRAAMLTRQLLAFSRHQIMQPKRLELNSVVENMGKMLQRIIGEDIRLITRPGPSLGQVLADPGQIEQVILNLAVNARDAMPHGGDLVLETGNVSLDEAYTRLHAGVQPGFYVMLAVRDTGCGMAAETRSHIFEPFFTTKDVGKGTGLGLSMVYGIIKQSGGHIWVYSEPGRGTTFKIYLPRIEGAQGAIEEEQSLIPSQGRETILLVEDEDAVRHVARRILQRNGYAVLEARDGGEALAICQDHQGPIHLVLTDLVMPGLNGLELAKRLVSLRPGIKVLFMSGYVENRFLNQEVFAGGGPPYIQKPFEINALAGKVRELLDGATK